MNIWIPTICSPVFITILDLIILKPYLIDPTLTPFSEIHEFHFRLSNDRAEKLFSHRLLAHRDWKEEDHLADRACSIIQKAKFHFLTLRRTISGTQNARAGNTKTAFGRVTLRGGGGEDALAVPGDLVVPSVFPTIQVSGLLCQNGPELSKRGKLPADRLTPAFTSVRLALSITRSPPPSPTTRDRRTSGADASACPQTHAPPAGGSGRAAGPPGHGACAGGAAAAAGQGVRTFLRATARGGGGRVEAGGGGDAATGCGCGCSCGCGCGCGSGERARPSRAGRPARSTRPPACWLM
jgi:hypothetical protein